MAANQALKLVLYELNPRYFYDGENSGIGNLKGLAQKFDYFKFLKVDGIILQDVLSVDSKNPHQSFLSVAYEIGTAEHLARIFELGKKYRIKVYIELNIGSIKEANKWFEKAIDQSSELHGIVPFVSTPPDEKSGEIEFVRSEKTREFYPLNQTTREVPLNWHSPVVADQFGKVISAWVQAGADGFVLKNFEYIGVPVASVVREPMTPKTLEAIKSFLSAVRQQYPKTLLIGKTHLLELETVTELSAASDLFDYFYTTRASMLGTKDGAIDVVGKFKIASLTQLIETLAAAPRVMFALGSSKAGRIVSRWGSDSEFHTEAAKTLGALTLFSPLASVIYFGDEIGTKNLGLSYLDDFQDKSLEVRRKSVVNAHYSEQAFMDAQVLQNPINARSIMAWNGHKNAGFSKAERTVSAIPDSYKQINVEEEFNDKTSVLHFYRNMITLVKDSPYAEVFLKGEFSITASPRGIVRAIIDDGTTELVMLANFNTEAQRRLLPFMRGSVILSSYATTTYEKNALPKVMRPFETIIFVRKGAVHNISEPISAAEIARLSAQRDQIRAAEAELMRKKIDLVKVTAPLQTKTMPVSVTAETPALAAEQVGVAPASATSASPSEATVQRERDLAMAWAKAQTRIVPQVVVSAVKPKTLHTQSAVKEATRQIINEVVAEVKTSTSSYVQKVVTDASEQVAAMPSEALQATALSNIKVATAAISNDAVTKTAAIITELQEKLTASLQASAAPVLGSVVEHVRQATREISVDAVSEVSAATKELTKQRQATTVHSTKMASITDVTEATSEIVRQEIRALESKIEKAIQSVTQTKTVASAEKDLGTEIEKTASHFATLTRPIVTSATRTVERALAAVAEEAPAELRTKTREIITKATQSFKTKAAAIVSTKTHDLKAQTISDVTTLDETALSLRAQLSELAPQTLTTLTASREATRAIVKTALEVASEATSEVMKTATHAVSPSLAQIEAATTAINQMVFNEVKVATRELTGALATNVSPKAAEVISAALPEVKEALSEMQQQALTQAKTIIQPLTKEVKAREGTSKITAARRAAQTAASVEARLSEDGPTKLSDADVAKTTQVEVDDVDDIDAFLRELDRKKR